MAGLKLWHDIFGDIAGLLPNAQRSSGPRQETS